MSTTKASLFILSTVFLLSTGYGQITEIEEDLRKIKEDTLLGWKKGGMFNLGFSQVSLTNWVAGGESSLALNGLISLFAHNKTEKGLWENNLEMGYGLLRQGQGAPFQKTDDRFDLMSKYGQRIKQKWYYAALFNFRTQFTDGFRTPEDVNPISRLFAPAYMLTALGIEYKPSADFGFFFAPLTNKNTFVLDEVLSVAGAFGVDPGKVFRGEFGGYFRMNYKVDLMENITIQTRLDLFSNYLNNPQNIDVSWETLLTMKVNKLISVTLGTHLLYDDDVKIEVDSNNDGVVDAVGPRVQFKQLLSVGLAYKF
jgi:hypothetical protein